MIQLYHDNPRSSPTESRTGPVLLHACLFDRMGSQLERLPHLGILDYWAPGVPYKLARNVLRHAGHSDSVPESIQALASHSPTTQPMSSDTFTGRPTVSVPSSPSTSSVLPGNETVWSSHFDFPLQALRNHTFTEPVVEMASASIRDSSSHLYNTHWKLFTDWLAFRDIPTQSASYHYLADHLVHMFNQNKQVNTIKVHPSSITRALRLLNPPNQLQDDTISNLAKDKAIQRPRTTQVLPKWRPSVVLKAFFKPLFTNNGSDKILLDFLTFKTAFLVSLESAARGSDLVALSWANHNITFSSDYSGARHVSIKMVPKFMPKNARLNTIPNPISFPGIAHLFPRKPERLLCLVRVLGLYNNRTQTLADQDGSDNLSVYSTSNLILRFLHLISAYGCLGLSNKRMIWPLRKKNLNRLKLMK